MKAKTQLSINALVWTIFVMTAAICLVPAVARATVSANINLSKLTGYQGETTIAIDPTNPNRMFASSNLSTNGLFAAYSTDGGLTWQYPDPTDKAIADGDPDGLPVACCDPSAVFDQYGNLFLTYLTASPFNAVVASSSNGGQTWTQRRPGSAVLAEFPLLPYKDGEPHRRMDKGDESSDDESPNVINVPGDQPTIAVGPSNVAGQGSVWITWNNGSNFAAGATVTGLGAIGAFTSAMTVPITGSFGDIAVGPSGQVLVTVGPNSGQGPGNITCSLDPDGLGPLHFSPAVDVTPNRLWRSYEAQTFGTSVLISATNVGGFDVIPAQPNRTVDSEPDLAWDRSGGGNNGRVYIAYTDETVNENNDLNILVRYSTNNGATWTAPVKANDDATTRSQFFPRIEVDQTSGGVAVAWYDARNDAGGTDGVANTETEVYGAFSFNGSQNFTTNEKISQGSSRAPSFGNANEYGDYNGLAFHNYKAFYIWADNSNFTVDNPNGTRSSPDIYTAQMSFAPSAAGVSISGRVINASGSGIRNATVVLTDMNGQSRSVVTGTFGYYRFDEVQAGQTYLVTVHSKRFTFANATRVISLFDDIADVDFVAQSSP